MQMPAADLAFTGFDDDSVDVLLQQLFETSGFLASGIVGIFQQNTIAFSREDIINPLNDPRENIIRQISSHYSYIVGFMSGT